MTFQTKLRVVIIGCGAITEDAHLPAVLASSRVQLTGVVDSNHARLKYVTRRYGIERLAMLDYHDVLGRAEAAVLALPNYLHAPIGCELLGMGVHVLCEKPLAPSSADCEQLCMAAQKSGCVLAVGYMTRHYPSTEVTKYLLSAKFLGRVTSFDYEFGTVGGWAPVSGYNLSRASSGGGVLMASGSHFLDRMLFFFPNVKLVEYSDDNRGGVESNCIARFVCDDNGRTFQGKVTLSKSHRLSNRLNIVGEKGSLVIAEGEKQSVSFIPLDGTLRHQITRNSNSSHDYYQVQLDDFVDAIEQKRPPLVPGAEAAGSIRVIEECYLNAKALPEPWCDSTIDRLSSALPAAEGQERKADDMGGIKRVLITGAAGFMGGRLCEVLTLTGSIAPRAFIHTSSTASRITRFSLDFRVGDLCDYHTVLEAMRGCDAVIHLARGDERVMSLGLENVLRAAVVHNVRRFVHMSSLAVYGNNPATESITETALARRTDLPYGNEKLRQENLVKLYGKRFRLPYVILRPPNVYGPHSNFSINVLKKIRAGTLAIVNGGKNPCSLVYIDNLIGVTLLALWKPKANGQIFFVTDFETITWGECLREYAALVGKCLPDVSTSELVRRPKPRWMRDSIRALPALFFSKEMRGALRALPLWVEVENAAYRRFQRLSPEVQQTIRLAIQRPEIFRVDERREFLASDNIIAAQARTVAHSSEKARLLLEYTGFVSHAEGMGLTTDWLRASNLI
jgi:predicted dehydrogenase/nucleoside-diphosphate-sugar epimerase